MFNLSWFFVSDSVVELSDQVNSQQAALATHIARPVISRQTKAAEVEQGVRVCEYRVDIN